MSTVKAQERVFKGRVLSLGIERHQLPDGREAPFEIVRHPGGAAVLPILPDGRVLLIKQFRPTVGDMVFEIPAGRLEPGESPEKCAGRELIEEVGYHAATLEPLGSFLSTVGFCDEHIHLFLGLDLSPGRQQLEADEVIDLCPMTLVQALDKISQGIILDSKTQLALLLYEQMKKESSA